MSEKRLLTRRNVLLAGAAAAGGLFVRSWVKKNSLPPTYGHILRMADNLTYSAHRMLLPGQSMVQEYSPSDITSFPAIFIDDAFLNNPKHPMQSAAYRDLAKNGFADWKGLTVDGKVDKPRKYSLAELKRLPRRRQITRHTCEEGWSAIGEWAGVQLGRVLQAAGMDTEARFVTFHCNDGYVDSIDLLDALHPQTLLAYEMNGSALSIPHGAPVRLRVETQLGYKSMKYVERIKVTSELEDGGENGNIKNGWSWYAGI